LKETREMQRKQNTWYGHEGFLSEAGVELRGKTEALSMSQLSERRKNDIKELSQKTF
jgi:hypothetical protein